MDTNSIHEDLAATPVKESWLKPDVNLLSINNDTLGILNHFFENEIYAY